MGLKGSRGFVYGCQGGWMGEYGVEMLDWVIVNCEDNKSACGHIGNKDGHCTSIQGRRRFGGTVHAVLSADICFERSD
jgi:hypothetical protein